MGGIFSEPVIHEWCQEYGYPESTFPYHQILDLILSVGLIAYISWNPQLWQSYKLNFILLLLLLSLETICVVVIHSDQNLGCYKVMPWHIIIAYRIYSNGYASKQFIIMHLLIRDPMQRLSPHRGLLISILIPSGLAIIPIFVGNFYVFDDLHHPLIILSALINHLSGFANIAISIYLIRTDFDESNFETIMAVDAIDDFAFYVTAVISYFVLSWEKKKLNCSVMNGLKSFDNVNV